LDGEFEMEEREFSQLVSELRSHGNENEWIEFKTNNSNPQEIGEYLSCLSNSACLHKKKFGYLVYGIDDKTGKVVGTKINTKIKKGNEEMENWLSHLLNPRIDFEILIGEFDKERIVIFKVDATITRPVKFNGIEYIRVGSYKKKLSEHPEKERKIWEITNNCIFENEPALDNIAEEQVLELLDYPNYFSIMKLKLPENRKSILEKLHEEGLISRKDGKLSITNLGAILFAKNLEKFPRLSRKKIRIIFYEGIDRIGTIKEKDHVKGYALSFEELIDYILDQIPSNEVIEKALRKKVQMYPEIAIRELFANVLIHQDFSERGTGPMIEFFSNRVEFTNPGKPLINPSRFIDHSPQSRNEKLAAFMRRINICEERGTGIDKVINAAEIFQLPAPEFIAEENFMKVILYANTEFKKMTKEDRIRACYQHCALKYVSRDFMTNNSLRERFKIEKKNYPMVSRIISDTIKSELIKRDDSGRYIPFWA
jgi:ATP-dependent DNA helicase RecG